MIRVENGIQYIPTEQIHGFIRSISNTSIQLETAVAGIRAYEEQMGIGKIVLQFH